MTYRGFGYVMDSCPTNETEFISAATRLNCGEDQYGRNQYTCVPNEDRSTLVEFCYNKTVAFYQKGYCLFTTGNGTLDQISCKEFITGCPEEAFRGNGFYNFSACSKINTEKKCFYADPSCPNTTESITLHPSTTDDLFNTTTNATLKILTTGTSIADEESSNVGVIIGIILCLLLLQLLVFAYIFWKRSKLRRYKEVPKGIIDQQNIQPAERGVTETGVITELIERVPDVKEISERTKVIKIVQENTETSVNTERTQRDNEVTETSFYTEQTQRVYEVTETSANTKQTERVYESPNVNTELNGTVSKVTETSLDTELTKTVYVEIETIVKTEVSERVYEVPETNRESMLSQRLV